MVVRFVNCVWTTELQVEEKDNLMRMELDVNNDFNKKYKVHLEDYVDNSTNDITEWLCNIYGSHKYVWLVVAHIICFLKFVNANGEFMEASNRFENYSSGFMNFNFTVFKCLSWVAVI